MIFFVPEATDRYKDLGLNWFEGYFCSRSAAFGRSSPEVVISTFYNFFPGAVRRAVEGGWSKTTPEVLAEARFVAAGEALRRTLEGAEPDVDAMWRLVENAPPQGRPLYAAHLSEARRDDPFEALWQAANLLREFRGDSHIAVLVAEDAGPVEALVLHANMMGMPRERLMSGPRDWPPEDVSKALKNLAARGFVDGETVTPEGVAFRTRIEDQTDRVSSVPFASVDTEKLIEQLRPIQEKVSAAARR